MWARTPKYVEHLHDVLDVHEGLLRSREVIMAGDFNSNAIWDKKHGKRSHSELVSRLEGLGLTSVYHSVRGEPHGAEKQNTFILHGHQHRPYHIDYVFVPQSWRLRIVDCRIGDASTWLQLSDHCPLTVDVAT